MPATDSHEPESESRHDQRGSLRRRVLKSAKIVYNDGHSVLDASLLDLSETGARIGLMTPAVLPEEFDLHLADGRKPRVEIVWRNAAMLGVRFVESRAPTPPLSGRGAESTLLDRISAIEEQLAELRRELSAQMRE